MNLTLEQRDLVRELAIQAGFDYDAPSHNILTPGGEYWCNQQVWKLAEGILENRDKFAALGEAYSC